MPICRYCGKECTSWRLFSRHLLCTHVSDEPKFGCLNCSAILTFHEVLSCPHCHYRPDLPIFLAPFTS